MIYGFYNYPVPPVVALQYSYIMSLVIDVCSKFKQGVIKAKFSQREETQVAQPIHSQPNITRSEELDEFRSSRAPRHMHGAGGGDLPSPQALRVGSIF